MIKDKARRVVVLGSTGSIGRQALEVIAAHPDRLSVVGLAAGRDGEGLREQARHLGVEQLALGEDEAVELATLPEADIVLNAIVGAAGLKASVAALDAGKTLALANKESLVAGGEVCLAAAARGGGSIVPVDSEHAAVAQCLEGRDRKTVERIVLTASGGPFRGRPDLSSVGPKDALKHPTWDMGPKITIDSATLMNKGLEVIEAHHLFEVDYDHIEVVVHPQSVIHAMVELIDGSLLMQAAATDMRLPIQAALMWPERVAGPVPRLDIQALGSLEFEPVDHERFPAVRLAYEVGRKGGTYPAVMNAVNEIAVDAFLKSVLGFERIVPLIEQVLASHSSRASGDLNEVLAADAWARDEARRRIRGPLEVVGR